jgi:hypothetical protein
MRMLDFTLSYEKQSDSESDQHKKYADRYTPSELVQFGGVYWSNLEEAFQPRRRWE